MTAAVRHLPAAVPVDSFSVVMATGILSVAAAAGGYRYLSYTLTALATAVFTALVALVAWRVTSRAQPSLGNLRDPTHVSGLYTFVAACDVLDASFYRGALALAVALGMAALAGWLVLAPTMWRAVRSRSLPELRRQARGRWLLAAVGTHSLAVTAAHLATVTAGTVVRVLLLAALTWWVLGVLVYLSVTMVILWGALANPLSPRDVTPDSWILMGGLAIAAFAGGELLAAGVSPASPWLAGSMVPTTLAVWIAGSVWIPALVAAEAWAGWGRRLPGYQRPRWATVFPLGMYAAATYSLASGLGGRPALETVAHAAFGVALAVWCLTTVGLLRQGWRRLATAHAA